MNADEVRADQCGTNIPSEDIPLVIQLLEQVNDMSAIRQAILECLKIGPCSLQSDKMKCVEEYVDQMVTIAVTYAVMPHAEIAEMLREHVGEYLEKLAKKAT